MERQAADKGRAPMSRARGHTARAGVALDHSWCPNGNKQTQISSRPLSHSFCVRGSHGQETDTEVPPTRVLQGMSHVSQNSRRPDNARPGVMPTIGV